MIETIVQISSTLVIVVGVFIRIENRLTKIETKLEYLEKTLFEKKT